MAADIAVSVPTLAWVLPLLAVVLWAWNRYITRPLVGRMDRWLRRRVDAHLSGTEDDRGC